jgi:hypothetical protein
VPGGAKDLPVGVAQPKDLPVVQRRIHGVGADRLVEVFGLAAAGVASGDGLGVRGAGRDASAGRLQQPIAADVVGVPVSVHHQRDLPSLRACPCGRVLGVADEAAVHQGRLTPAQQEQVGVGKRPALPGHPGRKPSGIEHHQPPFVAANRSHP